MTDSKTPSPGPGGDAPDQTSDSPGQAASVVTEKGDGAGRTAAPRRRLFRATLGVATLLAVLAAGYISWPLWESTVPGWLHSGLAPVMDAGRDGRMTRGLAAQASRLDRIEAALTGLRKDLAAPPPTDPAAAAHRAALENSFAELRADLVEKAGGAALARLAVRLDELEKRPAAPSGSDAGPEAASAIEALRAASATRMAGLEKENDALRAKLAALDRRVGAIGARTSAAGGPSAANALLLAVGQLRAATRGVSGFADALGAVERLAAGDAGIAELTAKLTPHAGKGAADLTMLRGRFQSLAGVIAAAALAPAGGGWVDRTLARISNLVSIRQVGESVAARDDVQGLIARTELRLAAGDLAGAVAALGRLTGAPATAAAVWLGPARARLAVDHAVAALFTRALGAVAARPRG